jgi:RHS repeat-associated protein
MFDAQGAADARAEGYDLATASDADLAPYASHRFRYNSGGSVVEEFVRGSESHFQFAWMTRATDPGFAAVNEWYRRCIETRPDGSTHTVYTNRSGSVLFSILRDLATGREWAEFRGYNENHHRVFLATAAAIQSWTEPADPSGSLSVTLKTDEGLIHVDTYYETDDFPAGEVRRYLATQGVKEGSAGTPVIQRRVRYDTRTVGAVSIHPIRDDIAFPVAGVAEEDAAITAYERTWHLDDLGQPTFQVDRLTTIPPVVSESEHGTGEEEARLRLFDLEGFLVWEKDARGVITWHAWDRTNGAEVRRIDDANPALLPDPPVGWVAPSFGGTHLVTDFINDDRGRRLREMGPEHTALVDGEAVEPCEPSHVRAVALRKVRHVLPLDIRRQHWSASGYVVGFGTTAESWFLLGPISIERFDEAGRRVDAIHVRPTCACGPLSSASTGRIDPHTGLPARGLWSKWSHTLRDRWGRDAGSRAYTEIPLVEGSAGFEGENYRLSRRGYDAMNRPVRLVSTDGTISRSVFDVRGEIVSEWIGTDDAGATATAPSGGGAVGNNMKPVRHREFDDGDDGGNGNLTAERLPVDDDPAHDRVTTFAYDFRDRRVLAERHDGTRAFLTVTDYDNRDQIVATTEFHHAVADANRIGRTETFWDLRGRDFESRIFGADPATGVLTPALVSRTWYDPNGNVIAATRPGVNETEKTAYDALNRTIREARVVAGTVPSGAPENDLTNDLVVEQNDTAYDRGGNMILATRFERLPSATGTGPLHGPGATEPRARRSFLALYHDGIGRHRYAADFGTNGGADLDRPELPPPPSDLVLVSETRYAADGQPGCEIGSDGVINRTKRNRLGEAVETVEALGTPAQRIVRFRHHASGQLLHLILENPDTGLSSKASATEGEQVTTWHFGTTLATSGIARNDLVAGQTYPTGESESYTFNRQSERITFTDANGSVREFLRDRIGRTTDDCAVLLAEGVDGAMRRVSTSYNDQGLPEFFTTSDDPDPGSGSVINQVQRIYDAFRLLVADLQEHDGAVNAGTLTVSYLNTNGAGNVLRRTATIAPSGARVNIAYGASGSITEVFNQVASLKVAGEDDDLVAYTYAGIGRVATLTYETPGARLSYLQPSGVPGQSDAGDELAGYDRFNRTVRMPWRKISDGTVLAELVYGFDRASRRTWRQDLTPAAQAAFDRFHGYDELGQVKSADRGTLNENRSGIGGIPEEAEAWKYDEQGNWERYYKAEDGATEINQTRRHNRSNQIVAIDGSNAGVSYDENGNMLRVPTGDGLEGPPRHLKWNAWNQMVEVRDDGDALIQRNVYDALFRRTTRELADATVIHCYFNDQWRPVEERVDESSNSSTVYYWGARHRDDLARRDRDSNSDGSLDESIWCLMDYFDPVAVVGGDGAVVERYTFTAFGVGSILAPNYAPRAASVVAWDFLFHGQFVDGGTGWQNYGYRVFVPVLGRWVSRDPANVDGGTCLYSFVLNSPLNALDWLGLWTLEKSTSGDNTKRFDINDTQTNSSLLFRVAIASTAQGKSGHTGIMGSILRAIVYGEKFISRLTLWGIPDGESFESISVDENGCINTTMETTSDTWSPGGMNDTMGIAASAEVEGQDETKRSLTINFNVSVHVAHKYETFSYTAKWTSVE